MADQALVMDAAIKVLSADAGFWQALGATGSPAPLALERIAARGQGQAVTDHRSSWVSRAAVGSYDFHVKTYVYPSWRDRWRGALRTTWLRPSRAMRESQALLWLAAHGLGGPRPLLVAEDRRAGWLHRAVLVTETWPGEPLHLLLPRLDAAARASLLAAVDRFVRRLHEAGFRDQNLDPRNLLARAATLPPAEHGWEVAKVDSPRFRLRRPGAADDRLAARDRERLALGLAQLQA